MPEPTWKILEGDARRLELPDNSVHVIMTSVPYWGLRNYGTDHVVWGGDPDCDHIWGHERHIRRTGGTEASTLGAASGGNDMSPDARERSITRSMVETSQGQICQKCGAWLGSLGLELSLEQWLENLVECAREWRRVLRGDGTLWINCGDAYAQSSSRAPQLNYAHEYDHTDDGFRSERYSGGVNISARSAGLKPKDMIGMPWRLAFALQADGWYLRNAICWAKGVDWLPNEQNAQGQVLEALQAVREEAKSSLFGLSKDLEAALNQAEKTVWDIQMAGPSMPESVTDRCATSYEMLFMFSQSRKYFFDQTAIKVPLQASSERGYKDAYFDGVETGKSATMEAGVRAKANWRANPYVPNGRNPRSVWLLWRVNTEPQGTFVLPSGEEVAHFAAWPSRIVRRIIKASTSELGVCATCGAPFERVIRRTVGGPRRSDESKGDGRPDARGYMTGAGQAWQDWKDANPDETTGWVPTCTCHGEVIEGNVPCRRCKGTGRHRTTVEKSDDHMPEGERRESHKRWIVPNMGENSMHETGEPCPACLCPDCEGTGQRLEYVRGGQPSKETAPNGKRQRKSKQVGDKVVFAPKEPTGEMCPTCQGQGALGYVQGPVWPDEVLSAWPIAPAMVLDPMAGSGTTGRTALEEGISVITNDLSPAYCRLMRARREAYPGDVPTKKRETEEKAPSLPLFEGLDIEGLSK